MKDVSELIFSSLDLVEELKKNDDIIVLNNHLFPPASNGDFTASSDLLGRKLDKDILTFYKETNGLQIRWISKNNPRYNPRLHKENELPFTYLDVITEEFYFDGCINILPLNEVFFDIDWNTVFVFDEDAGKTFNFMHEDFDLLDLKKKLRPFDLFARNDCMSFFTGSSKDFLPCVLQQSYYLDFNSSRVTDFTSYLSFVLENKLGTKSRRTMFNEINGHLKEKLLISEKNTKF